MQLDYVTASKYIFMFNRVKKLYGQYHTDRLLESISPNQVTHKLWLVENLPAAILRESIRIEIVGSWFGWPLVDMLLKKYNRFPVYITLYDIDAMACTIAQEYSKLWQTTGFVTVKNQDYFKDSRKRAADIVINCSAEHMMETFEDTKDYYTNTPLFAVQSNNHVSDPEHINPVNSINALRDLYNFKEVVFLGSKAFVDTGTSSNERFMIFGGY